MTLTQCRSDVVCPVARCNVKSMSITLIQRRSDVVCLVGIRQSAQSVARLATTGGFDCTVIATPVCMHVYLWQILRSLSATVRPHARLKAG